MAYIRTESIRPYIHIKANFVTFGDVLEGVFHDWLLSREDQARAFHVLLSEGDVAKILATYDDHKHPATTMTLAQLGRMIDQADFMLDYQLRSIIPSEETRSRIMGAIQDLTSRENIRSLISVAISIEMMN